MPKSQELCVRFVSESHVFENEDGTRVVVGTAEADGADITVKGEAAKGDLVRDGEYRLWGNWRLHPTYGRQFWFSSYVAAEPVSSVAIAAYLKRCPGIGAKTAARISESFGAEAIDELRDSPSEVSARISGLSAAKAEAASAWLVENSRDEKLTIELIALLDGRGFPKATIKRAKDEWGVAAPETIEENPFALMQFPGCGFLTCDKMYLDLGHDPAWIGRQAKCGWHAVYKDSGGSTWFPEAKVRAAIKAAIGGVNAEPDRALKHAVEVDRSLIVVEHDGGRWIGEAGKAFAEERISRVIETVDNNLNLWPNLRGLPENELTPHQFDEVARALAGPIGILRGSPGTGKTYCSAKIIKAIIASHGSESVAVAAPTGKAAVRITQTLRDNDVNIEAVTIHRLLKVQSVSGGGFNFQHDATNPMPQLFFVIDESSMIDASLMASFLDATGLGSHVLFVGDPYQLPPVGHGRPFLDMAATVPSGEITEIQRNSGQIVKSCASIRDTQQFGTAGIRNIDAGANLTWQQWHEPESQVEKMLATLDEFSRGVPDFRDGEPVDPVWDCQVLVPINERSDVSRVKLNEILQRRLNPNGESAGGKFRVGDKIICLKNDRYRAAADEAAKEYYVANGELGEVVEVDRGKTIMRLWNPDRLISVPKTVAKDENGNADGGSAKGWDLGYAISGHKSQGSEWPVVIVIVDSSPAAKWVINRNWIYTAISRAKHYCLLIGSPAVAAMACKRDGIADRKTLLAERLRGEDIDEVTIEIIEPVRFSEAELEAVFA